MNVGSHGNIKQLYGVSENMILILLTHKIYFDYYYLNERMEFLWKSIEFSEHLLIKYKPIKEASIMHAIDMRPKTMK